MFHNIIHKGSNNYTLVDSCFVCDIFRSDECSTLATKIAIEYHLRKLPIVPNVIMYYVWCIKHTGYWNNAWLYDDRNYIDKYYPDIQYSKKYFTCVWKQIKNRLTFADL